MRGESAGQVEVAWVVWLIFSLNGSCTALKNQAVMISFSMNGEDFYDRIRSCRRNTEPP